MTKENTNEVVVFSDSIGRLLIGEQVGATETYAEIANPHIVQTQEKEGKLAIGFIPYVYLELIDPTSEGVWYFPYSTCVFNTLRVSSDSSDLYGRIVSLYKDARLDMQQSDSVVVGEDSNLIKLVD